MSLGGALDACGYEYAKDIRAGPNVLYFVERMLDFWINLGKHAIELGVNDPSAPDRSADFLNLAGVLAPHLPRVRAYLMFELDFGRG